MATHRTYAVVPDGSPSKDAVTVSTANAGTTTLDAITPAGGLIISIDEAVANLRGAELQNTLRKIADMIIEDR